MTSTRLHTEQARRLWVQVTNHARPCPRRYDAFDDSAEHCLGGPLRGGAAHRWSSHQVVAHVLHRPRELANFLRAADWDRGGEITVPKPLGCICERRNGASEHPLPENDAGQHGKRGRGTMAVTSRRCTGPPTEASMSRVGKRASNNAMASPVDANTGKLGGTSGA